MSGETSDYPATGKQEPVDPLIEEYRRRGLTEEQIRETLREVDKNLEEHRRRVAEREAQAAGKVIKG